MKKSLIAIAALAAVSAASAQSSVTLYGLIDVGYGSQISEQRGTGTGTATQRSRGVMDGANAGDRIGFRGTEDLGGGLKANFVIEQGISVTSGSLFAQRAASAGQQIAAPGVAYPAPFSAAIGGVGGIIGGSGYSASTNRQSYVGLASESMGTVNIGYTYNNLYEVSTFSGYSLGTEGITGATVAHVFGSTYVGGIRSNGLTYISPSIAGGFTVRAQYGAGGAVPETNTSITAANAITNTNSRRYSLMGQYANGPLSAAVVYTNNRVKTAADPASRTGTLTNLGASYDFGAAKLAGTYNTGRDGGIGAATFGALAGTSTAYRAYSIGLSAPFGAFVPFVTIGRARATTDGAVDRAINISQAQFGVRYALSKRTTAYAFYGTATDNAANNALVAATAGSVYKDRKSVVGVAHSF